MNDLTKLIERLRELANQLDGEGGVVYTQTQGPPAATINAAADALESLQSAEPVAWRFFDRQLDQYVIVQQSDKPNIVGATPLFTHPAAPAPDDARDAPHIAPFRLLVAACNRLSYEAEEYTFDDGMGRGALQDYWDEFEAALERARESLND